MNRDRERWRPGQHEDRSNRGRREAVSHGLNSTESDETADSESATTPEFLRNIASSSTPRQSDDHEKERSTTIQDSHWA
ncbi:hypothetical protein ACFFQF_32200 [Haladaptatus pallidirubidus]|uniref:hypothetical protein n=1 Tax=Haladaptatus pallidirubidus TaxID=1008152 RepID=UPI001D127107|nr:hypothetical protein [Haladaptatus pallidirubidus]